MTNKLGKHIKENSGKVKISALLIISLLVFTGAFYVSHDNTASAGAITSSSDTLNDPRPTATSNHSIAFTLPTALSASDTVTVTFPSGFSTSSGLDFNDMDVTDDAAEITLAALSSGASWGATTSGDIIVTFEVGSGGVGAGSAMVVEIGDNATEGATGDSYITNPTKVAAVGTADIYTISIGGTNDSGDMLVAIIEGVTVSVTIDETLSFSIAGQAKAACDTAFTTLDGPVVTATSVAFGTATTTDTFYHGCQLLTISTNASSGYVVTTQSDTSLKTVAGVLINNGTCDGTCTETATDTWATASGNNGWAYSATGTDTASFGSDTDYRTFPCTGVTTTDCLPGGGETAQNIMTAGSPVSNSTSSVEYKISIPGTQAAGTYSAIVTYIATPTF